MRSSKSRSRSKSNRNRSMGNIVNRVFDSSGPEGKVRGTPQQIIDKYNQLARDAQLGNDRVATENFQQHAEHYLRMLAEAQREQNERREQQEREQEARREREEQNRAERREQQQQQQPRGETEQPVVAEAPQPEGQPQPAAASDVIDVSDGDSGLVETPESKPARKPRRPRGQRKQDGQAQPEVQGDAPQAESGGPTEAPEAAE